VRHPAEWLGGGRRWEGLPVHAVGSGTHEVVVEAVPSVPQQGSWACGAARQGSAGGGWRWGERSVVQAGRGGNGRQAWVVRLVAQQAGSGRRDEAR